MKCDFAAICYVPEIVYFLNVIANQLIPVSSLILTYETKGPARAARVLKLAEETQKEAYAAF